MEQALKERQSHRAQAFQFANEPVVDLVCASCGKVAGKRKLSAPVEEVFCQSCALYLHAETLTAKKVEQ